MSLTKCRECSHQVADSAPTCPHCGVTSPGGSSSLEIRRVKRFSGGRAPLVVFVDGEEVASLTSAQSYSMTVTPGPHRIECFFLIPALPRPARASQEFNVPPGERLVVTVATSRWDGKPLFTAEVA